MLISRVLGRVSFCVNKNISKKAAKAPKLLHGQLEFFKYDYQNARIYDGYTLDQLYGSKVGPKNPPSIEAEMKKDTFASLLLFGIGIGIIYHLNWLFNQEYKDIKAAQDGKLKRQVILPSHAVNIMK